MEHFINALKLYAVFEGRATRTEYWMFLLIYTVLAVCFILISRSLQSDLFINLFFVLLFIPNISVTTRRLHDTGRSGWWQLVYLIPLIGVIVMVIFLAQKSHADNEYGAQPTS